MKTNLPCAIVRDLLPSYAEGLTEEETAAAVKEHLDSCADCAARYAAMTGGEAAEKADTSKEVDYLKTVRKKNRTKIVLAVVLAVVLVLGGVGAKLFVIGSPADGTAVINQAVFSPEGTLQAVEFMSTGSGEALFGWETKVADGVVEITARKAPVSLFHRQGDATIHLPEGDFQEVRVFGRVIFQNNVVIGESAAALLDCRTPYVGDASAVSRMYSTLTLLGSQEGYTMPGCTMELETSSRPFAMIHHYQEELSAHTRRWAQISACLSLALVDNLEEVRWSWPDAEGRMNITENLTLEEANANLPDLVNSYNEKWSLREEVPLLDSVKDYAASASLMQQFYLMLVQG